MAGALRWLLICGGLILAVAWGYLFEAMTDRSDAERPDLDRNYAGIPHGPDSRRSLDQDGLGDRAGDDPLRFAGIGQLEAKLLEIGR